MDLNLTIGIPAVGIMLAVNTVINYMRFRNDGNSKGSISNGDWKREVREVQNEFRQCVNELKQSNVKQETYLETIVRELQILNSKM